ncbi:lipid II flippase MurJ [uncultured Pseudomonas sp.]|uniref:lipid II flippase MurJ n=1 Tax=uncultured Pseudomonas sp. TaxID=114707 RepID=UPI0025D88991|nr:lipid II flippase MurJ [uncultured Pseudomonas sp.]
MSSTVIILAITVASFLLGFLRDLLIARQFGVSWEADLIFVALILPVFFESFFGLALRDAMIPYLQRIRDRCNNQYEQVGRWLYWRIGLFGLLLSVIGVVASPWLMHALAPGWSDEQVEAGKLVFAVGTLLICVQAILYCQGALLNLDRIFILPMTRTLMLNLGAILAIVILQPSGISLFIGMLLPQVLLIVIQHRRLGYLGQRSVAAMEKPEGSPFALTFAPVLLAAGAQQGCMLAERFFASLLAEGNITMLSFSYRIVTIPLTLYALSILAMIFPELTRSWNEGSADKYAALMRKALLGTLLFLVPAAVVLFGYAEPVVKVLLERGAFGAEQSAATATLVVAYALGLPWMGLALLWGRALLSQQRARTFLYATLASSLITVALDACLYKPFGAQGLAYSFTTGAFLQALFMALALYRHSLGGLHLTLLLRWFGAGSAVALLSLWLPKPVGLLELIVGIGVAMLVFVLLLLALGERDLFRRAYWARGVSGTEGAEPSR